MTVSRTKQKNQLDKRSKINNKNVDRSTINSLIANTYTTLDNIKYAFYNKKKHYRDKGKSSWDEMSLFVFFPLKKKINIIFYTF